MQPMYGPSGCRFACKPATAAGLGAPPCAPRRPLPPLVAPVLLGSLQRVLAQLQASFPAAAACLRSGFGGGRNPAAAFGVPGADLGGGPAGADLDAASDLGEAFSGASGASLGVQRPRLLICGPDGTGQSHLGPAVLYALEGLPVHAIGLPSLLSDAGARAPEEALVHAVVEARRAAPAVLFLPHLQVGGAGPSRVAGWTCALCCAVCLLSRPVFPCYGSITRASAAPPRPHPAGVVGHRTQLAARHALDAAG